MNCHQFASIRTDNAIDADDVVGEFHIRNIPTRKSNYSSKLIERCEWWALCAYIQKRTKQERWANTVGWRTRLVENWKLRLCSQICVRPSAYVIVNNHNAATIQTVRLPDYAKLNDLFMSSVSRNTALPNIVQCKRNKTENKKKIESPECMTHCIGCAHIMSTVCKLFHVGSSPWPPPPPSSAVNNARMATSLFHIANRENENQKLHGLRAPLHRRSNMVWHRPA